MCSRTMVIIMLEFKEDLPCSEGPQSLNKIQQHKNLRLRTISDNCTNGIVFSARKDHKKILGTMIKHTCPLICICHLIKIIIINIKLALYIAKSKKAPGAFCCCCFFVVVFLLFFFVFFCFFVVVFFFFFFFLLAVPGRGFCCGLLYQSLCVFVWVSWWGFYFGWPFGRCFENLRKRLSFWLSASSVLIVVPLLYVRLCFPLVSWTQDDK